MKKLFAMLLAIMMMVALTACSTATPNGADQATNTAASTEAAATEATTTTPVEITFWAGLTGADLTAMQDMVAEFNAEQSAIKVNFYSISWSEIFSKFETSFNTKAGPDVMLMHVTDIPSYASRDMLNPVDDLISASGLKSSDYSASVWNGQFYNGTQYAVPLDYHCMAMYVNKDLFTAAGLDPTAQFDSKESFLSACEALKASGVYPISLGATHAHSYRYWYGLLYQLGGSFCDADFSKAEFASQQGADALNFLYTLVQNEYAPYNEADIDADWLAGKTAMVIDGPWFTPTAVKADFEFTTVPFLQIGDTKAVWGSSHTLTIPRYDDRSAEATQASYTFLSWFIEHSYEWGATSGQVPANNSVVASDSYKSCSFYPYQQAFIQSSEWIHYEPLCTSISEFGADNALSPVMAAISNILSENSSDTNGELASAAEKVDQIFQEGN